MASFAKLRRQSAHQQNLRAKKAVRDARVGERIDPLFVSLSVLGIIALAIAGYFAALSIDRSGAFDPPFVQPLPDERILSNLRNSDAPFVGAGVLAEGTGQVVMLREDGQLNFFDESTGLVSTSSVSARETGFQSEIAGLSVGCGRAQPLDEGYECPAPDLMYLLSKGGGVTEGENGRSWKVRLRDAPWVGLDEKPVTQADIVAWAASDDGRWIGAFAGPKGCGFRSTQ